MDVGHNFLGLIVTIIYEASLLVSSNKKRLDFLTIVPVSLFVSGSAALAVAVAFDSYILAFIGLGLAFWGALFVYVRSTKMIKLELMNSLVTSAYANVEKILTEEAHSTAVYLPPKCLKDYSSSVIYISESVKDIDKLEDLDDKTLRLDDAILLTPPGKDLADLLERRYGRLFTETDLKEIIKILPTLLEKAEIANETEVQTEGNIVTVELQKNIFTGISQEMNELQKTRRLIGSPLSSAIACILAKATAKPIVIENEDSPTPDKTIMKLRMLGD